MRTLIVAALLVLALAASSCSDDSKPSPTPAASPTKATATEPAAPTPASTTPPAGTVDEVTGIVGSVSAATRTILIDRLSGAQVAKITVDSATVIRKASGDSVTLGQIHPSDRIVASGRVNDRGDALEADHVTVQDVVPGAQPGG